MAQNQMVDVTVTIDADLKKKAEVLFQSLGINFSYAFSAFVSQAIQQGKVPPDDTYSSELEAEDPFFNRATQLELRRRIADMEAGRNTVRFNPLKGKVRD